MRRPPLITSNIYEDDSLKKVPKKFIRREQREREKKYGKPIFTPREVRILLKYARGQLRAMILLAVSCAMSQRDIGELEWSHVDLETGYLDYTRRKTEMLRQAWLWPEVVAALKEVRDDKARSKVANPAFENRVFRTRWGRPFWYEVKLDKPTKKGGTLKRVEHVSSEFRKLIARIDERRRKRAMKRGRKVPLPLSRFGRNFRALRRTFRTASEGANISPRRQNTIRRIMGHEFGDNDPHYLRAMPLARLKKVGQYLRQKILKLEDAPGQTEQHT
ncbi:MAG TPA: hypothetical protein VFW23_13985 [Tepidisphaeraceae bacterium]|nr:hypothetical protein [Tepidisphaeraceae bacterium]